MAVAPLSLGNVQGDILFGLPKQTQSFFFFQINEVDAFRSNLSNLVPLITSAQQTQSNISEIRQFKIKNNIQVDAGDGEVVHPDVVTVSGVNIAFSATGLQKIGITDNIGDTLFNSGMLSGSSALGDNGAQQANGTFQPNWDEAFLQEIHGVTLVTGDSHDTVNEKLASVKDALSGSVTEISTISGDVRPGDEAGHEQ
ncbi:MAG: hypothetical protein M1822_003013 [Bathelium mastoideum]|nr:MAG: hypothetical protein M1822_003013 [Bathelium mastoideum]